jgi:hypothetical protein
MKRRKLRAGDWVEVRSKEEILKTLDGNAQLEGMPFMPEMFAFCGKTFRVYKRAHKTCDTVFPIRARRLENAVHLETRCTGEAHGGCEAGCLIFWKEAWLRPVTAEIAGRAGNGERGLALSRPELATRACDESVVWFGARATPPIEEPPTYICQATRLPYATGHLSWWDIRQYVEDYVSGNVGVKRLLDALVYSLYYNLSEAGIGVGRLMRWFYDLCHPLWGGTLFPRKSGTVPSGLPTPTVTLRLQPGEIVRVKAHEEILKTVGTDNKNRGMYWDAEMVPYCGGTYRVLKRVTKLIDERTGRMREMKNPCIVLDSVVCGSRYSTCRMLCPRSIYPYWREVWLERVEAKDAIDLESRNKVGRPQPTTVQPAAVVGTTLSA